MFAAAEESWVYLPLDGSAKLSTGCAISNRDKLISYLYWDFLISPFGGALNLT
jgi:hypothetical protein